jgi:hypothetical protein
MVVGNNESMTTKHAGKLLAILVAMRGAHRPMEYVQGFI